MSKNDVFYIILGWIFSWTSRVGIIMLYHVKYVFNLCHCRWSDFTFSLLLCCHEGLVTPISTNNHDCDNNSLRVSWSWEHFLFEVCRLWSVLYKFPFRLWRSHIVRNNKGFIHCRKWEHVTIRAWEKGGGMAFPRQTAHIDGKYVFSRF